MLRCSTVKLDMFCCTFLKNVSSLYLNHVGDDNLELADDRDPGWRLEVHGEDEAVLLYQTQDADADGHRPLP